MKKTTLLFAFCLSIFISAYSQTSSVMIYSEQGEKFSLMMNGKMETSSPVSNIELTDLPPNRYSLIITMEPNNQKIEKAIYVEPDYLFTYEIIDKSKTGMAKGMKKVNAFLEQDFDKANQSSPADYTIRLAASRELSAMPPPPTSPHSVSPHTGTSTQSATMQGSAQVNSSTQTESYSQTTTINAGGTSVSATVKVEGMEGFGQDVQYSEQTQTTQQVNQTQTAQAQDQCSYPMSAPDFQSSLESIKAKSFEDSKMQIAKQVTKSNCLKSEQVKQIMQAFTFEETRLEFAKFAYQYTFDKGNYYKVNDAFQFELSIEELDEYLGR